MYSGVETHLLYRINNARVLEYPYPHTYVENVFPEDFYRQLRDNWPHSSVFTSLADTGRVKRGTYRDRYVLPFTPKGVEKMQAHHRPFWRDFGSWFMSPQFLRAIVSRFESYALKRFGQNIGSYGFGADSLLVRDTTNYSIGPHTDAPHRLLSMLFYCPDDGSMPHLGTSIYTPLDAAFRCKGGIHYPHSKFVRMLTMEYKPNSLFAFFKTDNSFHGVEPIKEEHVTRDLILYDVRVRELSMKHKNTTIRNVEVQPESADTNPDDDRKSNTVKG